MKKLAILAPFSEENLQKLRQAAGPGWTVTQADPDASEDAINAALEGAEVVIGEPEQSAIAAHPGIKWVQMTWAGTDKYTRSAIPFPKGVLLTNASGTFGDIIAQYLVAMTLSLMQNLPAYRAQQHAHVWQDLGAVHTLENATVLIFGAGDIGGTTARRLNAFGTFNVGVCRNTAKERPGFDVLCTLEEAEAWLPRADVVLCCIPSSDATDHYFTEARLHTLKADAILVNAGRGRFIDCNALASVLTEGHLLGAALDVTEPEPLPADHPLWDIPNCIITPHVAGITFGHLARTQERMCAIACENLRRWNAGEQLKNLIAVE